jgi:hypothetical protein
MDEQIGVVIAPWPAFTIFAVVVDSLKALCLNQPIREENC